MNDVFSYETNCHILLHILFLFLCPFPPMWYLLKFGNYFSRGHYLYFPNMVCMTDEKELGYF